jgi:hypothetical protein
VFANYNTAPGNMQAVKDAETAVVDRQDARGVDWSADGDGDVLIEHDESHRTVLFVSGSAGEDVQLHRQEQRLGRNGQWGYDPERPAASYDLDDPKALDRAVAAADDGGKPRSRASLSKAFGDGPHDAAGYLGDILDARAGEDRSLSFETNEDGGVLVKSKNGACGMTMRPDDEWGAVVTLHPHRADGTDGQPAKRRMREYRGGSGYSANAMRDAVSQACEYASPSPKPSGRRDYGAALKEGGAYRALGPEASEAVASATEYALLSARETPDVKVSHSGSVYLACGDPSHRRVRISTSRRKEGIWLSQAVERRGENGRWRADKGWSSSAVAVRAAGRERGDSENAESIIRDAVHNAQRVHRAD